ncbi:MAG: hypothetical protein R3E44_09165 [Paracoccaceae bacterium]
MSAEDQWPEVRVVHVMPCGTASLPLPDGTALTCRVALGHLDAPDTGLLDEMRRRREPTPWRSLAARDEALASIGARADLGAETRDALLRHVTNSPYYEGL